MATYKICRPPGRLHGIPELLLAYGANPENVGGLEGIGYAMNNHLPGAQEKLKHYLRKPYNRRK